MTTENTAAPVAGEDTSAVLAALEGDKTYLAEPPEPPKAEEGEAVEEAAAEPADTGDDAPATEAEAAEKRKMTARERVEQAVARQREAEREAEFWKAKATQPANAQPAQEAQFQPQGDGRPDPNDYETDADYWEAVTDWKAEMAASRAVDQFRQAARQTEVVATFETRAKALFPEGEPEGLMSFRAIPELPMAVMEIVSVSDVGPKLAAHLGDNPAELQRLAGMSPVQQARELTRLETRLVAPPAPATPPPKTATSAPEPPPQARGSSGQFKVSGDTDDFAAFERQYRIGG